MMIVMMMSNTSMILHILAIDGGVINLRKAISHSLTIPLILTTPYILARMLKLSSEFRVCVRVNACMCACISVVCSSLHVLMYACMCTYLHSHSIWTQVAN